MTNVMVTGNTSKNNGGGLFIDPVSGSSAGSSTFTNTTFTGNTTTAANTDGGGIRTQRGLVFNGTTIISNNTATRFGGGISMDVINTSVNLNEATMVGNSAGTTGGAIEVGSITTGNVLNLAFSRVVGNTGGGFTGVATRGGTANMKNNWWGCNGGPSAAPCNTAGTSGGGSVDFTPWLRFTHTASPAAIALGQTSTLTASFLTNSAGTAIAASDLDALIGVPIAFGNAVRGAISGAQATIQSNGTATATFTGTSLGAGSADATVDSGTATASLTINKANTTTTITSDNPDPSVVGQTITVAYTVAPQFSGTPTGTVTVSDGVNSCMATVAAGQCNLALTTAGARTLTATYAGDTNFNGSASAGASHQVNKANTTTTITAESADPTNEGEMFTVFYAVAVTAPGAGTASGNVTVSDGVNSCMGTAAAGQCSLALSTPGNRTLTATYAGNANFNGSVSAGEPHTVIALVVNTTTTITGDSPDPSVVGQNVTVTYTVAPQSGSGTPTGNVTVSDGVNSCMGTVAAGQCTLALTTVGARTLTATYAGNTNFNGSTSAGASHQVNQANTTTTITAESADPTNEGETFTVFYAVAVTAPGAGTPSGNVTVSDGVNSCMGTAAAGQCTLALTTPGNRTLTATYAGNASFNSSVSAGEPHTVIALVVNTTTTITGDSPDPSVVGQNVTVTYTVVAQSGSNMPAGNVTVSDGVNSCMGTVAAGQCTLALTTLGARTLTATYAGNANFNGSTSAGEPHQVNQANTTTPITAESADPTGGRDHSPSSTRSQ